MSNSARDPAADLLASLRADNSGKAPTGLNRHSYSFTPEPAKSPQHPRESSTKYSQAARPSSSIDPMSHKNATSPQAPPDLLGLLKFGQTPSSSTPQPPSLHQTTSQTHPEQLRPTIGSIHGRGVSASDLVSTLMGGKISTPPPKERVSSPPSTSNHQDSLLRLLNQTASSAQQTPSSGPVDESMRSVQDSIQTSLASHRTVRSSASPTRHQSPIHYFGSKENTPIPFDPHPIATGSPLPRGNSQSYLNPFEQQTEVSPDVKKPRLSSNGSTSNRRSESPSSIVGPSTSRDPLTSAGNQILHSVGPTTAQTPKDGRSRIESLMGIGAPSRNAETVARALNEVGDQVDRQVNDAFAEAEKLGATVKEEHDEDETKVDLSTIQEHVHDAAAELKKELDKPEKQDILREAMPTPAADAVKEIIDDAAKPLERHETKEGTVDARALVRQIKVHQFPMRPFVSIDLLQKDLSRLNLREQSDFPVARFKKDFDQADRSLATATTEYIIYAVPKTNGGVRVIEQDSGTSSIVFPDTHDRAFSVSIATNASGSKRGPQNVIATGISGTVYWTTISEPDSQLSQSEMQAQSVYFPPNPASSDSTSGGQLKTRAKKSSRHPEFFAVGRGKSIQIVFPAHARISEFKSNDHIMDTEKYFSSRSLKIMTGKAGKDFTFSEDDTVIVTLDKAGKLRVWDIRELTDSSNESASRLAPIEVKAPILSFATANSAEKSWPTSVLFVDKLRPYTKGTALRYIIVGMKQNHSLQLWDLCLGKAVQELNFSHESETDAICSVAYHPASGVIVVGHPTRNSIYFIHLSAPKYNLPNMSQAKFAQRLANKDSTLPKAEATAIMSGMREYSLADKGQLRSVELTHSSGETTSPAEGEDEPPLFELIIMHSKGVLCLGVKKEDLGLSKDSRVLYPVDAEQDGSISVKELKEAISNASSDQSAVSMNGDAQTLVLPNRDLAKSPAKENMKADRNDANTSGRESEKKKSKKNTTSDGNGSSKNATSTAPEVTQTTAPPKVASVKRPPTIPDTSNDTSRPNLPKHASQFAPEPLPAVDEESTRTSQNVESVSVGISGDFLNKEIKKIEQGVSMEFSKVLGKELDSLHKRWSEDKRIQDAAGAAKQDAILRLVSSTLGDNVEKSLSNIVRKSIQETVLPSIETTTTSALNKQISNVIGQQTHSALIPALKQSVTETVKGVLQGPDMIQKISDHVSRTVSANVEREISSTLTKTITPTFQNLAMSISQKVSGETERRVRDMLQQADTQRRSDSAKIDSLTSLVGGLSEMLHTMATAQSHFQGKILELQEKAAQVSLDVPSKQEPGHSPTPSESASMHVSPEQEEIDNITILMNENRYEDATIQVLLPNALDWNLR